MTAIYDVLLAGGRVVDPGRGLNAVRDVAIADGRIAAIGDAIAPDQAREVIDVSGKLVLPGLIDTHAHVFQHVSGRFGLNPDLAGVRSGVTALVDQGGPSCMTFPAFRNFIAAPAESRVYAFLSAYVVGGLEGHYYPDLYGPTGVDVAASIATAEANRDLVKGFKAHAEIGGFARWGADVIRLAKQISRGAGLPLYIHFGQLWPLPDDAAAPDPDTILPTVLDLLDPGDVLAHPFTRHPGGFVDRAGHVHPLVREAVAKGLKIDVGHGSHFSLNMARKVLDAGIMPDTLGADMHGYNTPVPAPPGTPDSHPDPENHPFAGGNRFSLTYAMTELLALGVSLDDVVAMTTTNCAELLGLAGEIGTLAPGAVADVSVLHDQRGRWRVTDNDGAEAIAERWLTPAFCLRTGRRIEADAPILPVAEAA